MPGADQRDIHVHDVHITKEPPNYRAGGRRRAGFGIGDSGLDKATQVLRGSMASVSESRIPNPESRLHADKILLLDFGAQYTQLIARRLRELGVSCEVWEIGQASRRERVCRDVSIWVVAVSLQKTTT